MEQSPEVWPLKHRGRVVLLFFAAAWGFARGAGSIVDGTAGIITGRPAIRVAYLYDESEAFAPIEHMMSRFDGPNRTVLPDFDLVVHGFSYADAADVYIKVTRALSGDTPTYHAITGPWGRREAEYAVGITQEVRVLGVVKADNTEYTDQRAKYPYVYRTLRSISGIVHTWMYVLFLNDWRFTVGVWLESTTLETSMALAARYNITNYGILATSGDALLEAAWQSAVLDRVRSHRIRVVMSYVSADEQYGLVCKVHRDRISGMQYITQGSYVPGWFLYEYDSARGDCTPDEVYIAVGGHLLTVHTPVAPGVNLFGIVEIPAPSADADESQRPLTCLPGLTPDSYFHNGEALSRGIAAGAIWDAGSAQRYLASSGTEIDMVCASFLALHDAIYNKGVSPESIESRDMDAFLSVLESVSRVEMQGPAGSMKFYNGTGDPEVIYYILSQYAVPWLQNDSAFVTSMVTFPNGPDADPLIQLRDENIPFVWRDGSVGFHPRPSLGQFPLCGIENAELIWDECVSCPAGTSYDSLLDRCRTCPLGDYQDRVASAECITSPPGTFINDIEAPTAAVPCPFGHGCAQYGTISPQPCAPGRYANETGMADCILCPTGRYQPLASSSECEPCDAVVEGSTTANIASTSPSQCICPAGMYRPLGETRCLPCLEGMLCEEGSDMANWNAASQIATGPIPVTQLGYMTTLREPLTVYLCKEEDHCPGGQPGTCAIYRDASTVACGDCVDTAYDGGETCEACGETTALPFVTAGVIGIFCVIAATLAINRDMNKTPAASLMIVALSGLMFTSLQALGVFSQMAVPWVEPVKTILRLSQLLSFDLKLLKVGCVMGVNPVRSFAFRQSVAVLAIPCITVTLLFKKYAPMIGKPATRVKVELSNSIGTLYSVFFISIMISALNPFICYRHPGESGESVQSAPSLLCFDSDDHSNMIVIGVLAMCCVPLPFLALCTFGVVMYPRRINSHDSNAFLHAMRFLFFRYTPKRYYFQMFILWRSLLLCLIPALLRGQAATQVLFMCLVLCIYTLIEEECKPWRATLCNPLDATMTMMLLIMLICGALFLKDTPQKAAVAVLSSVIIVGLLLVAILGIGYATYRRFVPRPFYDYFICHHKAHAAGQARFLKILIQGKKRKAQVFIDSDNLRELDGLFDIVRCRLRHLVVLLTSDTLRRPWCAGEIVTALRARLQVTGLETSSFVTPLEEHLEKPETYLDTIGCNLSEYGIQFDDVGQAFRQFLSSVPRVLFSPTLRGTRRLTHAVNLLLKQRVAAEPKASLADVREGGVVISTYAGSDEANASGGILASSISQDVYRVCEEGMCMLADFEESVDQARRLAHNATAVVVILGAGCMSSTSFLAVVCELMLAQECWPHPAAISVNTPGFAFPPPNIIEALPDDLPELARVFGTSIPDHMRAFFKLISILLPTHASQQALDMQAAEVFDRISAHMKRKGASKYASGEDQTVTMSLSRSERSGGISKQPSMRSGRSVKRNGSRLNSSQCSVQVSEEPVAEDNVSTPVESLSSPDGGKSSRAPSVSFSIAKSGQESQDIPKFDLDVMLCTDDDASEDGEAPVHKAFVWAQEV